MYKGVNQDLEYPPCGYHSPIMGWSNPDNLDDLAGSNKRAYTCKSDQHMSFFQLNDNAVHFIYKSYFL